MITVDINGKGDYISITEALNNTKENETVFIKKGVYREKLILDVPNVTFKGEDKNNTVIVYNDGARKIGEDGEPIGTFATATMKVTKNAHGFKAENITFANDAGMGDVAGQAVALEINCDKAVIKNCILKARQDTLLTGPMFKDIEDNPGIKNRHYFENCYIEGDVDFIFGGATAIFDNCEIYSLNRDKEINGYLTAPCTEKGMEFGYVFMNCRLTGEPEYPSVYLSRPWREYGKVVFISCEMGKHIHKDGFSKWNDTDRHKTCYSAVYDVKGEYDTNGLVEWAYVLSDEEAEKYTIEKIFEGWNPNREEA
ncbi:MAG: pectin methylesterase [Firmicutes bacterium]|nr:pectin methylesterase [Bacillota bacterium]